MPVDLWAATEMVWSRLPFADKRERMATISNRMRKNRRYAKLSSEMRERLVLAGAKVALMEELKRHAHS